MSAEYSFKLEGCTFPEEIVPVLFQLCWGEKVTVTLPEKRNTAVHAQLYQLRVWKGKEYGHPKLGVGHVDTGMVSPFFEVLCSDRQALVDAMGKLNKEHRVVTEGEWHMDVWS